MKTDLNAVRELVLCQDKTDLADKAAHQFAKLVASTLEKNDKCNVALSGGSTPKLLYERLLQADLAGAVEWNKIAFFVSDERCVDHASNDSNFGNADRQLLQPLKIAQAQQHPTEKQEADADKSAADYETQIRKLVKAGSNGLPRFDIIFLGMGPDGHTASLFPGSKALDESKALVVKNYVEKVKSDRITFTFSLINSAANVIFLVSGEDKAEVLAEVIADAGKYPSERVKPFDGKLVWFVDKSAASHLS